MRVTTPNRCNSEIIGTGLPRSYFSTSEIACPICIHERIYLCTPLKLFGILAHKNQDCQAIFFYCEYLDCMLK